MNKAFIQKMKDQLLEEKKRLDQELGHFAHRTPQAKNDFETNFPNFGEGEDENASEVAKYGDDLSVEDSLEKSLQDAEAALDRLEKGLYGVCKYCQSQIDERRLEARPSASSCIACKKTLTQEV